MAFDRTDAVKNSAEIRKLGQTSGDRFGTDPRATGPSGKPKVRDESYSTGK